ncbi:hypothetical protein CEXT_746171 [Caerostris extrusa]|uniref:Uncharacterized protein n=1 Tax=Caerostris extrusa TaxID=172846 RepID=A0AAV4SWK1_CAEEX|nr:hypothetical protein CEXT_746171 [Caerostris extrusa]
MFTNAWAFTDVLHSEQPLVTGEKDPVNTQSRLDKARKDIIKKFAMGDLLKGGGVGLMRVEPKSLPRATQLTVVRHNKHLVDDYKVSPSQRTTNEAERYFKTVMNRKLPHLLCCTWLHLFTPKYLGKKTPLTRKVVWGRPEKTSSRSLRWGDLQEEGEVLD